MKKQAIATEGIDVDLEEEMIGLFHNLESTITESKQSVIQFVSSHKNEGVSTVVREFASVASTLFGKTVLVLDASGIEHGNTGAPLKETDNNKDFSVTVNDGVISAEDLSVKTDVEFLTEETDDYINSLVEKDAMSYTLQPKNQDGFYLGSLSGLGASISVIFSDRYFAKFLNFLRKKYDLVIIDTPPIRESSIGLAVSGKVDGVILVVAAETTRWPVSLRLKDQVEKVGGKLLGVILNKQKHYIPNYIYNHFL